MSSPKMTRRKVGTVQRKFTTREDLDVLEDQLEVLKVQHMQALETILKEEIHIEAQREDRMLNCKSKKSKLLLEKTFAAQRKKTKDRIRLTQRENEMQVVARQREIDRLRRRIDMIEAQQSGDAEAIKRAETAIIRAADD